MSQTSSLNINSGEECGVSEMSTFSPTPNLDKYIYTIWKAKEKEESNGKANGEILGYLPSTLEEARAFIIKAHKPETIPEDLPIHRLNKVMLRSAFREFYERFDYPLFSTFEHPEEALVTCIWGIFRKVISPERVKIALERKAEREREKREEEARIRKEAARKRAEKEREEMLRLGGGDMEKGRRRFEERMRIQGAIKREKPVEANLALRKKFLEWWESSESNKWREGMRDASTIIFRDTWVSIYTREVEERRVYLKTSNGMKALLHDLSLNKNRGKMEVKVTLKWDAVEDPYSVPVPHVYNEEGASQLKNHARKSSPWTLDVLGIEEDALGNMYLLSKEFVRGCYRLFPKEYSHFESRNPKKGGCMRVLYELNPEIISVSVCVGKKHLQASLRKSMGRICIDESYIKWLVEDKTASDTRAEIERMEREKRDREERLRMEGKKRSKTCVHSPRSGSKFCEVCDKTLCYQCYCDNFMTCCELIACCEIPDDLTCCEYERCYRGDLFNKERARRTKEHLTLVSEQCKANLRKAKMEGEKARNALSKLGVNDSTDITSSLASLTALHSSGALTDEEFAKAKSRVLG